MIIDYHLCFDFEICLGALLYFKNQSSVLDEIDGNIGRAVKNRN